MQSLPASPDSAIDQAENSSNPPAHLRGELKRIARVMYTQNLALAQINRMLTILRTIDLLILESNRDLKQLSTKISKAVVDSSPYSAVAIFALNQHDDQYLTFQGWALTSALDQKPQKTLALESLYNFKLSTSSKWLNSSSRSLVLNSENQEALSKLGISKADIGGVFNILRDNYDVNSVYLTKLGARGDLTGLMLVGLEETEPHIDDIELIERLSEPTGIAIDNRLLFEENQRVLKQSQQTNDKLKEIDAAKDEFISMASHQLRTPLTSMKGYVSMILEGDVGPVTPSQHDMLQQALNSSQRMVYMIADLLNVSRLHTGKFLISNKKTDLVLIVESEISELSEIAKARGIKVIYEKPENFPTVMLDETKIRQVVMNFLDNAMYYTPRGGRVTVELKATDNLIEYMVTDTGLGVPQTDQKNLFTKFFRAANARKMRPDGTGLGLYMCKKVILSEGGSILFKSVEGEGSIFGFRFPRDSIEAK
jgi:signal transduction histidine kinase